MCSARSNWLMDWTWTGVPFAVSMPAMILPDRSNHERAVTIRSALPGDRHALELLAELDSQRLPEGPLLLAEVAGSVWAAVSLDGSVAIANPFERSGDLVTLL